MFETSNNFPPPYTPKTLMKKVSEVSISYSYLLIIQLNHSTIRILITLPLTLMDMFSAQKKSLEILV